MVSNYQPLCTLFNRRISSPVFHIYKIKPNLICLSGTSLWVNKRIGWKKSGFVMMINWSRPRMRCASQFSLYEEQNVASCSFIMLVQLVNNVLLSVIHMISKVATPSVYISQRFSTYILRGMEPSTLGDIWTPHSRTWQTDTSHHSNLSSRLQTHSLCQTGPKQQTFLLYDRLQCHLKPSRHRPPSLPTLRINAAGKKLYPLI